jgi:5-methylcytosine-specific restriction endonuclease McrA
MKKGKPLKRTPLAHRSKKMIDTYKERIPLVKKLLSERPWCEACPVFAEHDQLAVYIRRPSVDVHEIKRRSQGGSILDEKNLMTVCRQCHQRIGNYPQLAFDLGLAIHGWEETDGN